LSDYQGDEMATGRRNPLAGRSGQVIAFLVTTVLVAAGLALAYAPLWVVLAVAILGAGVTVVVWLRERRR
jgi:Flp pilus assembly protein TadB